MKARLNRVHLAVALFVLVIAAVLLSGALLLPTDKGYSILGTYVFPTAVSVLMSIVGISLLYQALTGGFRLLPPPEEADAVAELTKDRVLAVVWVSGGLLAHAFLIERIGFVFSATILFVAAARGFGSRAWIRNILIGLALAWPVYLGFSLGLGLSLPGIFKPWI